MPPESQSAPSAAPSVDAAAATTSRSVLRGGAWYTASYAVPQLYTAITSIIAARFLGKADFGQQSFIALNSILIATLLSSSMFLAVMRYVGETVGAGRPQVLRGLLGWAWKVNGVAATAAAVILVRVAVAGECCFGRLVSCARRRGCSARSSARASCASNVHLA